MSDEQTDRFYADNADAYGNRQRLMPRELERFLALLPKGARILELGCGGGHDALEMQSRGFDVMATDGSRELAAIAERRLKRPVEVMRFDDLAAVEQFDGVWASASLLHVPRDALAVVLRKVYTALIPGGRFWASYKTTGQPGRDRFGRYYNRLDEAAARILYYEAASWHRFELFSRAGSGYDGEPTAWLWVAAVR